MLYQTHESYKYVLPLKIDFSEYPVSEKKCHDLRNVHFEEKCSKIKKKSSPLTTTFYIFALKIETC